jgi:hypothetical protein
VFRRERRREEERRSRSEARAVRVDERVKERACCLGRGSGGRVEKELAVTIANASPRRGGRVLELQGEAAQQEMELR